MSNTELLIKIRDRLINSRDPFKAVCKEFNVTTSWATRHLREELNFVTRYDRFMPTYQKIYEDLKNGKGTLAEICKKYNIHPVSYQKILRVYPEKFSTIKKKTTYQVNTLFFRSIDTEEKAYWLGFLYADGYNSGTYIQIAIISTDDNHLRKFRKSLQSTHPIRYYDVDNTARITISDKQLSQDLKIIGCVPRKTYVGRMPKKTHLPDKWLRAFIRGYFDGDGNISKLIKQDPIMARGLTRKIKKVSITTKTKEMAQDLVKAIEIMCGIHFLTYWDNELDRYEIYAEGEINVCTFLNAIYREAHIYLDRKYKQYLEYIMPSDLEIDRIISEKLSGNILSKLEVDTPIGQSEPKAGNNMSARGTA